MQNIFSLCATWNIMYLHLHNKYWLQIFMNMYTLRKLFFFFCVAIACLYANYCYYCCFHCCNCDALSEESRNTIWRTKTTETTMQRLCFFSKSRSLRFLASFPCRLRPVRETKTRTQSPLLGRIGDSRDRWLAWAWSCMSGWGGPGSRWYPVHGAAAARSALGTIAWWWWPTACPTDPCDSLPAMASKRVGTGTSPESYSHLKEHRNNSCLLWLLIHRRLSHTFKTSKTKQFITQR